MVIEWKQKDCPLFRCEDRLELAKKEKEYDDLREQYDQLKLRLDDFNEVLKTGKFKIEGDKGKELIQENLGLRNEVAAFNIENDRLKSNNKLLNTEVEKLKENIKDINQREILEVKEYHNLDGRKETLKKEVDDLESKNFCYKNDNEALKDLNEDLKKQAKLFVKENNPLEFQLKELKQEVKLYLMYLRDSKKLNSFKAKRLRLKIMWAKRLVGKGKLEKAKLTLDHVKKQATALLNKNDKRIIRLLIAEQEARLK